MVRARLPVAVIRVKRPDLVTVNLSLGLKVVKHL
jgi:hypothetical protein